MRSVRPTGSVTRAQPLPRTTEEMKPYVDEVFIGATDDVVVGDSNGVDAAPTGLQDVNTLQRADVPNLTHRQKTV